MNSTSPSGAATVANIAYCYVLPVVCAIGVIGKQNSQNKSLDRVGAVTLVLKKVNGYGK